MTAIDLRLVADRDLLDELDRRGWTCERHKPQDDNDREPQARFFSRPHPAQRARHDHPEPFPADSSFSERSTRTGGLNAGFEGGV
jgi:hypothetical protein